MRYGDKGSEVKKVQESLVEKGYALPRYGADGHLGDETWESVHRYAKDQGLRWDPSIDDEIIDSILEEETPVEPDLPPVPPSDLGAEIVDLRSEQAVPSPKSKVVSGRTVSRNPKSVTGIVLHQTACTYGVSQNQINAAGGDKDLALQRRALGVACHAMAFRKGWVVWSNPLDLYIYHGNGFNSYTLGLEVEGRYPGLTNSPDSTTWGGDPTPLTQEIIDAARAGVALLLSEGRKMGMPIEYIYAHRQSSDTRRSDPGEGLWRDVVLGYAIPVLGLKTKPAESIGSGMAIPVDWDPDGRGKY